MFKKMKLTIRVKLITFFVLVGLIPALVVGLISLNEAKSSIQSEVFGKSEMFSEFITDTVTTYFEDRRNNVGQLSNALQVVEGLQALRNDDNNLNNPRWLELKPSIDRLIKQTMEDYHYELMFMTDANGTIVYSTVPDFLGLDMSNRTYVQSAIRGQITWSEFAYSSLINKNFMGAAAPVYGQNNTLLGTIAVAVEGEVLGNMIHSFLPLFGETADAYMFNADGLLLTNTVFGAYKENAILRQTMDTESVRTLAPHIRSGNYNFSVEMEYLDYEGEPVIGAADVVKLGDTPVGLVAEVFQSEAYRGIAAMQMFMYVVLGVTVPLVILVGFLIAVSFARPIVKMQEVLSFVGNNDLRVKAHIDSNDEIGMMANDLNATIDKLNESLNQVKQTVENVNHGSEEIAAGNQDLSQRTEEQASALEEIASTIEEITSSMEASSANAVEADTLSKRTLQTVQDGEQVVNHLQQSMAEITRGSREISEIISTVNDIAFQTNLLALNAAVEAARAGEQGRGFAVVAAEVRNLAGRSAEAAKEIEKLIKSSIERVDRGNAQMEDTQRVLNAIVENTKKTTDVVGEISASLSEQTLAATDIRKAIEELNQVTQQNASLVEEIASSSENMSSEAMELAKLVSMFKLSTDVGDANYNAPSVKSSSKPSRSTSSSHRPALQAGRKQAAASNARALPGRTSTKKAERKPIDTDDYDFNESDFEKF